VLDEALSARDFTILPLGEHRFAVLTSHNKLLFEWRDPGLKRQATYDVDARMANDIIKKNWHLKIDECDWGMFLALDRDKL